MISRVTAPSGGLKVHGLRDSRLLQLDNGEGVWSKAWQGRGWVCTREGLFAPSEQGLGGAKLSSRQRPQFNVPWTGPLQVRRGLEVEVAVVAEARVLL